MIAEPARFDCASVFPAGAQATLALQRAVDAAGLEPLVLELVKKVPAPACAVATTSAGSPVSMKSTGAKRSARRGGSEPGNRCRPGSIGRARSPRRPRAQRPTPVTANAAQDGELVLVQARNGRSRADVGQFRGR